VIAGDKVHLHIRAAIDARICPRSVQRPKSLRSAETCEASVGGSGKKPALPAHFNTCTPPGRLRALFVEESDTLYQPGKTFGELL